MHKFTFIFIAGAVVAGSAAANAAAPANPSCYFDSTSREFRNVPEGGDVTTFTAGTLQAAPAVVASEVVMLNGLRYKRLKEATESLDGLNEHMELRGTFNEVQLFGFRHDLHNDHLIAIRDPGACSLTMFHYRPELHFAWIEQKSFGLEEFLFKHPGLVVDPASFQKQGEYLRGIGFDVYGHPHKQEDGTQPRYNRSTIEVDCPGKRLRMLDQRIYEAQMKLVRVANYTQDWASTEDVYPALGMLAHAMCEVPADKWGGDTKLPATLDEFSDYVHAAAHGKI